MSEPLTYGQVAHETYWRHSPLPPILPWTELSEASRLAWEAAACAVLHRHGINTASHAAWCWPDPPTPQNP
jgi:hypothetical protein